MFFSTTLLLWIVAFAAAAMMTDMSFRRQGGIWILRLYFRASAVLAVIAMTIIYESTLNEITAGWSLLVASADTVIRQMIVAITLVSAIAGGVWLIAGTPIIMLRAYRYLRLGRPWMPWNRELGR